MAIKPKEKVADLDIPTLDGGRFRLADRKPRNSTMVVFHRGYHGPICKTCLRDLDRKLDEFTSRGVDVLAVSTDTRERAARSKAEWGLERLPIAYGLSIDEARRWGLYAAAIQTMPFARPSLADVVAAVDVITKNNYPPRGEA